MNTSRLLDNLKILTYRMEVNIDLFRDPKEHYRNLQSIICGDFVRFEQKRRKSELIQFKGAPACRPILINPRAVCQNILINKIKEVKSKKQKRRGIG